MRQRSTAPLPAPHYFGTEDLVNNIIWLVGAVVIVLAILGFLGIA